MSTLHLLPTWLVPEARWQRTGILSSRPVHSRARVNTMAKNKYSTYFRNTHPTLSQSEVRKSTATRQINYSFSMWCMHAHLTYVPHTHTHTHAAPGFRRVAEKQPFTSYYKPQHTSQLKNLLLTFTFTNSTPSPPYTNMLHWNTSRSEVTSFANTSRWKHLKLTTYCI
jgi:hypothetical protein